MNGDPTEAFEEGAKAVSATASAVGKVVDAGMALVNSEAVQAAIGALGGDWLIEVRNRNKAQYKRRTEKILGEAGVTDPVLTSPTIAIPLMGAAQDETREELQDLWARLLAAAMDPDRSHEIRAGYIEIAKKLDPIDVLAIKALVRLHPSSDDPRLENTIWRIADEIAVSQDAAFVTMHHLIDLGLVIAPNGGGRMMSSPLGRQFLRCAAYPNG